MESESKIVSAIVSTEPSCKLAASSQNLLPGSSSNAASSSQNSLPGGSFMEVNADMNSTSTEPTCELAASYSQNSLPGCSSLVSLHGEDVPGSSLNGYEPCQLRVVELKCWLKCRAATTIGKKQDL